MRRRRLTDKQIDAAELLRSGMLQVEVAAQLGIPRSTLSRWTSKELFQAYISDRRRETRKA